MPTTRETYARTLRIARTIHRTTGVALFVLFALVATSGLMLGWKKHTGGVLLAKSHRGTTTDPARWLPIHELHDRAVAVARDSISPTMSLRLDRIDIRPDKGMVKFVFAKGYWGVQLDCATGEVLHIERRRSDFIEDLHDGSILDDLLGTSNEQIKLGYTSLMGLALLTFTVTGFWLWYGPRRMRGA
ncbi:MAG: PepSY domain-containing protein [Candidatus Eisenbacteria bacterium]|uniref:PepSY domain-containing protein n=1 Tax=Eiseniibacteriota bacterium TaxID=2212470 RepID=A0A849SPZ6_UNCEI|nr:PepSY domain-containing protein [Candidatus Eisenbacteria bacterium]